MMLSSSFCTGAMNAPTPTKKEFVENDTRMKNICVVDPSNGLYVLGRLILG
jgi:hypothetical protein